MVIIIITKDMFNQKVPREMFPTRLDSATDLYTYTKEGLVLYNINPTTWNVLYPFFQQNNKFTMDNFDVVDRDITYRELIDIYMDIYTREYESKMGFNEEMRKFVLIKEFSDTFGVCDVSIDLRLDFHFELKYSKSKNVYTLYYLESYIAKSVNNVDKLLSQKIYQQEFLNLDSGNIPTEIKGIKLVDSLSLLKDSKKLALVKSNMIGTN